MKMFISILTALACTTVVAGQCAEKPNKKNGKNSHMFEQGDETLPAAVPAAYNAPAGVVLKKNYPDFLFNLSFLYYYASQDGMDLASSTLTETGGGTTYGSNNGRILTQDFDYKPAFQIGLGGNFNEWQLTGNYTWIRQTTKTEASAPVGAPVVAGTISAWSMSNWFVQPLLDGYDALASAVDSKWNLQLDIGDLTASRPFYEGRKLVVSPFFGFRTAWIRQNLEVEATMLPGYVDVGVPEPVRSITRSNSWGVGPRAGFGASGLLGFGFHIEGSGAISVLYTEYTTLKHKEGLTYLGDDIGTIIRFQQGESAQVVRPELDMSLGFGWGSYLGDQQFHLDFSASYDFTVFWQQNMMRSLMNQYSTQTPATGSAPGALYLQGLRLSTRFDF